MSRHVDITLRNLLLTLALPLCTSKRQAEVVEVRVLRVPLLSDVVPGLPRFSRACCRRRRLCVQLATFSVRLFHTLHKLDFLVSPDARDARLFAFAVRRRQCKVPFPCHPRAVLWRTPQPLFQRMLWASHPEEGMLPARHYRDGEFQGFFSTLAGA